jgi:hypothetical protein
MDYIVKIDDNDKVYKEYLDIKTYHKKIRGFDMFVYKHINGQWVCTDSITGSCIDNIISGHKTKKQAFDSAIQKYSTYTDEQIIKAHKNALEWIKSGKAKWI